MFNSVPVELTTELEKHSLWLEIAVNWDRVQLVPICTDQLRHRTEWSQIKYEKSAWKYYTGIGCLDGDNGIQVK